MHSTTHPEMRHGVRCGRRTLRKQVPPNPGTARDRWEAAPREFTGQEPRLRVPNPSGSNGGEQVSTTFTHGHAQTSAVALQHSDQ